jgi:ADP-ribose pyrophosphatase YjhB (NUDIX family)
MQKPVSIAEHTNFANVVNRVAVEHEGKYLLVQEGKPHVRGLWSFPGGKVDVGEQLTEAAVREVMEETGVKTRLAGIIGIQHVLWEERPGFTLEIELVGEAVSIPDTFPVSDEILAIEWKTKEEILQMAQEGTLRNKGQEAIIRLLAESAGVLPISALVELSASPPGELRN